MPEFDAAMYQRVAPRRPETERTTGDLVADVDTLWSQFYRLFSGYESISAAYRSRAGELEDGERHKAPPIFEFAAPSPEREPGPPVMVPIDPARFQDPGDGLLFLVLVLRYLGGQMDGIQRDIAPLMAQLGTVVAVAMRGGAPAPEGELEPQPPPRKPKLVKRKGPIQLPADDEDDEDEGFLDAGPR